jgi:AcrR family transcriptional regulator
MRKSFEQQPNLKEDIIKVAITVFSEKGYDATNMTEIADILGITRTPLYYYYNGKKDLYTQAIKKHLATKREIYAELAADNDDIFTWLHKHIKYACSNTSDAVLFNAFKYEEFRTLSDLNAETNRYIYSLKKSRLLRAVELGELPSETNIDLFIDNVYILSYGLIYVINDSILSKEIKDTPGRIDLIIDLMMEEIKATFCREHAIA